MPIGLMILSRAQWLSVLADTRAPAGHAQPPRPPTLLVAKPRRLQDVVYLLLSLGGVLWALWFFGIRLG